MALTPGLITVGTVTSTTVQVSATAASGGTAPYTYQWYMSTEAGFSPSGSNDIPGATSLTPDVITGLIPGTTYYFDVIATDDAATPDTGNYVQVPGVTLAAVVSPNQFGQSAYIGMVDLRFNPNTVSVLIDASETGTLYAGAAVTVVDSAGGVPKVVAAADDDEVMGFIQFDIKTVAWEAGMPAEIGMAGNCMYLYATTTIARGARVVNAPTTNGGVAAATGSTGWSVVGWAYDKASSVGQLIRVMLQTPTFLLDE